MHEATPHTITQVSLIAHGLLAFFGAIVHAARAHRLGEAKSILDFFMLALMSSFSGVMFALMGFQFFPDHAYLTMAMAGTGGYLGVEGMAVIVERIKSIIVK